MTRTVTLADRAVLEVELVNDTDGYRDVVYGQVIEPVADMWMVTHDREAGTVTFEIGELFRSLVQEYGRCTGKVYMSSSTDDAIPIGWVFQKRLEYEGLRDGDAERTYLCEAWVTFVEQVPATSLALSGIVR